MSVERNLIISLLKLTKTGPVLIESVNQDARIPSTVTVKLLGKLQNENLLYLNNNTIEVDSTNRLKLALKAASLGADIEGISNLLCWQEFEEIAALALKNNGYTVQNNVRFKHDTKRWEIDVVACKKPLVICIDCKHWQRAIASSPLKRIVELQSQRTKALADSLPNISLKLECAKWEKAKFIPAVLSLIPSAFKFYHQVPIVPVLSLQDFIYQLPVYTEELKFFSKTFKNLSHDFQKRF
jgi:Holliday junction resolvase-like predicted endonuclease